MAELSNKMNNVAQENILDLKAFYVYQNNEDSDSSEDDYSSNDNFLEQLDEEKQCSRKQFSIKDFLIQQQLNSQDKIFRTMIQDTEKDDSSGRTRKFKYVQVKV